MSLLNAMLSALFKDPNGNGKFKRISFLSIDKFTLEDFTVERLSCSEKKPYLQQSFKRSFRCNLHMMVKEIPFYMEIYVFIMMLFHMFYTFDFELK